MPPLDYSSGLNLPTDDNKKEYVIPNGMLASAYYEARKSGPVPAVIDALRKTFPDFAETAFDEEAIKEAGRHLFASHSCSHRSFLLQEVILIAISNWLSAQGPTRVIFTVT